MDKKVIIAAVILIIVGVLLFSGSEKDKKDLNNETNSEDVSVKNIIEATFANKESSEEINVVFNNEGDTATLNGLGFSDLVFTIATSASGARYENEEEGLVLWNKGNDITLYEGEEIIFEGTTPEKEVVVDETGLSASTWVWQSVVATNEEDSVIPKNVGDFTLNFDPKEGRVFGTTDCNNFNGSYAVAGDKIKFDALASTLMFCEDSQEADFTKAVASSTSFSFDAEGNLQLHLEDNGGVVEFTKG